MNCNNIINIARQYCMQHSLQYKKESDKSNNTGFESYKYVVMNALLYWIETLVDEKFSDQVECITKILSLLNEPLSYSLSHLPNEVSMKIVEKTKYDFMEFIKHIDVAASSSIQLPYRRTIIGAEKERVGTLLADRWNYTIYPYWNPLYEQTEEETLFVTDDIIMEYKNPISCYLVEQNSHIFRYGEGCIEEIYCAKMSEFDLDFTRHMETAYFNESAAWIIYVSHEDTITFAGSILPTIKEILYRVRDEWNKF